MGSRRSTSDASPGSAPIAKTEESSRTGANLELPKLRPLAGPLEPGDGILFAGNAHESVPRRLFLDPRLTPLERNAWQVIRLALNEDGITAFPTYGQLRPFLASLPCSGKASDETIARALTALRLTRWLTLASRRRDPISGRMKGSLYVLHDEPLTPYEALCLDPEYLTLVSHALTHASKTVQFLGFHVLDELTQDPHLTGRVLPSRVERLRERLAGSDPTQDPPMEDPLEGDANPTTGSSRSRLFVQSTEKPGQGHTRFESGDSVHRISGARTSDSEEGDAPSSKSEDRAENGVKWLNRNDLDGLRNPKTVRTSTVRTVQDIYNKLRTIQRAPARPYTHARVRLPEPFARLREEQQTGALAALKPLDSVMQQAILDEWAARCRDATVRNPAGYLFGLIQRALRGDFRPWAGRNAGDLSDVSASTGTEKASDPREAERGALAEHIEQLRDRLTIRR